ncbi:hypothetical protein [Granulicoccus sp. GXG6511]|uniref:hypothetical protein n=1 Tax=Granulicoccus sp. GXG6511 TaxID=3381351 RepID=UPI003D7E4D56
MADSRPPGASDTPRRAYSPDSAAEPDASPETPENESDTGSLPDQSNSTRTAAEPAPSRPSRPPVVTEQAEVIERTRPGRIQWASERAWGVAVALGALAFITAWIGHRGAVDALITKVPEADPETQREAAGILHYTALAVTGAGVLAETLLLAFLRRRGNLTRVLLSLLAVASVAMLPLALEIIGPTNWLGVVVTVGLITHAVGALLGSVLMWLPIGRRRPT